MPFILSQEDNKRIQRFYCHFKKYKFSINFQLRLVVIYIGDVKSAEPDFETNCITIHTEQAFISHIDGEAAFNTIRQKIHSGRQLDDDLMKPVILPLTVSGSEGKQKISGTDKEANQYDTVRTAL